MKKLLALMLLICAWSASIYSAPKDDFTISLTLTIGERSRDSHSETTRLQLTGNTLTLERDYKGYGANRREPLRREFKLKGGEVSRLKDLVKEQNLLGSGSLKFEPAAGQHTYFELNIRVTLKGVIATQELSGPREAANIKGEPVYQKSLALLQELQRLINLRDKELRLQEPVH